MRLLVTAGVLAAVAALGGSARGSNPAELIAATPAWAPDGTHLAFAGATLDSGRSDIYTVARDGTEIVNLTSVDDEPNHLFPAWSHDGDVIASATALGGPNDNHEVYSVTPSNGGMTAHIATSTAVGPTRWSYDDRWIAFDARESALVAKADGSEQHELTAPACCAIWAPHDVRLLVYRVHAAGDGGDVYLVTPAGHVLRRLTRPLIHRVPGAPLNTSNTPVAWSRDGRHILFWSTRTVRPSLYVMRADGSGQRRIAPGRNGDFSPSGTQVVYAAKGIWVVRSDATGRRRLAPDGAWPRWSPHGGWIAFVATRAPGVTGIDLIRPDGTDRHALVGGSMP